MLDLEELTNRIYLLFDQPVMPDVSKRADDAGLVKFFAQNTVGQARGEDPHGWGEAYGKACVSAFR